MATATEGYVDARTDAVRAEQDTAIARALLTLEQSAKKDMLWLIGFMAGLVGVATGVIIAVLR